MSRPFVIAEAGVNHNGDLQRALEMVDVAAAAGADCVKFQAFEAAKLVARGTATADYQARNTEETDQLAMIAALELPPEAFAAIARRCEEKSIEFLCTAFDEDMIDHLVGLGMRRIKVASGELTNTPALTRFARIGLPVLLSTGMATDAEVDGAVLALRSAGATDITILQCTSIYPAPIESANLRAMVEMGRRHSVRFGLSDHTLGDHAAVAATALGAEVVEKHFTLDKDLPGPDHKASADPAELAVFIRKLREAVASLGSPRKQPDAEELRTAQLVRRSWHARSDLPAGTRLTEADVVLKRPAAGLPPDQALAGRTLVRDVAADTAIRAEDLA